jgi:hypothetical protein
VAIDTRLEDVKTFVRQHLDAEAALSIAALGEPDDDAYLEIERRAKAFYAPGTTSLAPLETRWATPGGTSPDATRDATGTVHAAPLYAIGSNNTDTWITLVGERRDSKGHSIGEALLIRATPDGLRIVGRAAFDPFSEGITFEPSGGEPVDVARVEQVTVLLEPLTPEHAEFVRGWGRS